MKKITNKKRTLFLLQVINNLLTNIIYIQTVILLIFLLNYFSFVDELQQLNIFFYIHALTALSTYIFALLILILLLIFIIYRNKYIKEILKQVNFILIILSLFTLISGIFWGIFSWGSFIISDPNSFLLFFFLFLGILIEFFIIRKINQFIVYLLLFIGIILIPLILFITVWISAYHQTNTMVSIGLSFPYNLFSFYLLVIWNFFCLISMYLLNQLKKHLDNLNNF